MSLRITENAEIQATSDAEETAIQIDLSGSFPKLRLFSG